LKDTALVGGCQKKHPDGKAAELSIGNQKYPNVVAAAAHAS
jgi:hypothetical protein